VPSHWRESVAWSPVFFTSTIGLNREQIIKYVRWQERQESGRIDLTREVPRAFPVGIYGMALFMN
jgi:hypothetical protein